MESSENSEIQQKISLKIVSLTDFILLNLITLGFYSLYWHFSRSKMFLQEQEQNKIPLIYLLTIGIGAWFLFRLGWNGPSWMKWGDYLAIFVDFFWTLWISRQIARHQGIQFPRPDILGILLFFFGSFYLQYKVNDAAENENPSSKKFQILKWSLKIGAFFVGAIALFLLVLRFFFVSYFSVPTEIMVPTILPGDRVICDKRAYSQIEDVQYGDVIVLTYKKEAKTSDIKRVVGKPGDRIAMRNKDLIVNGEVQPKVEGNWGVYSKFVLRYALKETLLKETVKGFEHDILVLSDDLSPEVANFPQTGEWFTVPEDSVFVLSDRRDFSSDSRQHGAVPFENIKGKAVRVLWSMELSGPNQGESRSERFLAKIQ